MCYIIAGILISPLVLLVWTYHYLDIPFAQVDYKKK